MKGKILSIQSHVVHGYVGNKAATFPLQYKGWDVDAINTVQFSNHPGYGHFSGFRSTPEELEEIIEKGLLKGLDIKYDAVITGYLPSVEGLSRVWKLIKRMEESTPGLKVIVDPVLGDNGRLYVPEETVPIYRDILKQSRVFLATPNQFEIETLTGVAITDQKTLKASIDRFHELYPRVDNVIATSVVLPALKDVCLISACSDYETRSAFFFEVPKIGAHFSGSGDLLSALLLDALVPGQQDLVTALNKSLSLVESILQRTYELNELALKLESPKKINDLKLIECRDLLKVDPPLKYTPQQL
ncbi:LAMI_0G11760g1_1 [Lachancea mirantina]|uniref:pyridoxal kinase n=1 Tax=Lachancea mirantina TaxID=1230905 RepID=A0A1G4KB51_9SACH|nr:LAMI_0G11760g1_1 [Lachancea mirantina]